MGERVMIITIDGPSASGKSVISRILAQKIGYYYVGSGILYRAIAYLLVTHFAYTEETIETPSLGHISQCLDSDRFFYEYKNGHHERIFFDGCDITPYLKDSFFDKMASLVSMCSDVRNVVTHIQRDIAADYPVVVEGRDAGSVVFPDADIKFFLTALPQVRAERWRADQEKRGNRFTYEQAFAAICARDDRDKNRATDPMVIPDDAIIVDTSDLTIDQSVAKIILYIERNIEIEKATQ